MPQDDETAVIIEMGIIGLLVVAALRILGSKSRVIAPARYEFQAEAAETTLNNALHLVRSNGQIVQDRWRQNRPPRRDAEKGEYGYQSCI
jgi:threonine dehydrogenase-like Zn-dependent dehydrogenase